MANVTRDAVDPALAKDAATDADAFGLDLFAKLRAGATNGNIVFSPTSIAIALAMARAGARGETATQMDAVLHSIGADDHAAAINALDSALNDRTGTYRDSNNVEHDLTLKVANAPFAQRDEQWEQSFLDVLAQRFGAGVRLVDYRTNVNGARQEINQWVSDQTAQRIPELIGPDVLDATTRLVLANAIYLKAPWQFAFESSATVDAPFTRLDESQVSVPMMSQGNGLAYAQGAGWQAVELPYAGNDLGMTLILPADFRKFVSAFDLAHLDEITRLLIEQEVDVTLPKFSFETVANLNDPLQSLGMADAFSSAADFSGMTSQEPLQISDVIHQANISVDEIGTEAAAATAVAIAASSAAPHPTPSIRLDRPFLFALRDKSTGAILFMGQVTDPSAVS